MDFLNAIVALTNFVLIPGVAYGAQLAIGALGVTLVYGILRFSNFAHGDTMAIGTMFVILITWWFQGLGLSLGPLPTALLALPFRIALTGLVLLGTDKVVYRFYRRTRVKPVVMVMAPARATALVCGQSPSRAPMRRIMMQSAVSAPKASKT